MRETLAAMLMLVACAGVASAQSLEVHLTQSESGGVLRAGALYVATPISRWLYLDMAIEPFVNGALRPHRDIYLVGPDGTRIPQPGMGTIRANREEILGLFGTISTSDAAAMFPISRQFSTKCGDAQDGSLALPAVRLVEVRSGTDSSGDDAPQGDGRPDRTAVRGPGRGVGGGRLRPHDRRPRRLRDGASGPDRVVKPDGLLQGCDAACAHSAR